MSRLILALTILLPLLCYSQDVPLFRIIAAKGSVLLDEDSIHSGQIVTSVNKKLQVSARGYVSVLTDRGYAFRLGRGSRSVKAISKMKRSNFHEMNQPTGAVHRNYRDFDVLGMNPTYAYLACDSLTIIWKPVNNGDSIFKVRITSLYDSLISDTITSQNFTTMSVPITFEKEPFFFRISSENRGAKYSSNEYIVRSANKKLKQDFRSELNLIPKDDFIENTLLILGNCEIYEFYYNQIYYLNKLWQYSRKNNIEIKNNYYLRLLEGYKFNSFLDKE